MHYYKVKKETVMAKYNYRPDDLFNEDNTSWVQDEYSPNSDRHLEYDGDMLALSKETGYDILTLYGLLAEYEDMSRDRIEYEEELRDAATGRY